MGPIGVCQKCPWSVGDKGRNKNEEGKNGGWPPKNGKKKLKEKRK